MFASNLKLSIALVVAISCVSTGVNAGLLLGADLDNLTVFSNTYTTTGASSAVYGNVLSGGVTTTGANSAVTGNIVSVGAFTAGGGAATVGGNVLSGGVTTIGAISAVTGNIVSAGAFTVGGGAATVGGSAVSGGVSTTGESSQVGGNLWSGRAATVGANSTVVGNLAAVGLITISASGSAGSVSALTTQPVLVGVPIDVLSESQQVTQAQSDLSSLGLGTNLLAVLFDKTLNAGVYSAASLSTTAGTTLTLDGQGLDNQSWVFNVMDILSTGANTNIVLINAGAFSNVFWNSGGYASLGADSVFLGTVFANTYVSVGANTFASGIGSSCGGIFSATSYVSTGAGAVIGGIGCSGVNVTSAVPAPASLALFGLGVVGLVIARRRQGIVRAKRLEAE